MKVAKPKFACLLGIFACIIATHVSAQTTFVRMYNKGNMGYATREVGGNSYVSSGSTDFYYNWHWLINSSIATTNMHLFKTDINGVLQWERIYSKLNTRLISRWMEPTFDGGYILTGAANSDIVWPPDSNDIVLVKTDASGLVMWAKVFDTGKDELGFCVQQTADSGYIISGFHDVLPVSLVGNTYIILIKTDAVGNIQWEKKYQFAVRDLNTHEPFSYVVKQTANGGYIVVGAIVGAHPADANVLCTDAAGNIMWAKSFEHDASMWRISLGIDITETATGDFVIAGSMDKDSPLHINYPYFLKISSVGAVLKARFFETVPSLMFQSGLSSVQQTSDGGFFFTGMGGYSDFGDQAQLLKTDANLDMQWSRVYTVDGFATLGSMSGRQTSDGGFIFTGKRQMSGSILMKTDRFGIIPCKTPGSLTEYIPSVIVQNWTPAISSGINAANLVLNIQSPLADTTMVCPLVVTHLPVEINYFNASAVGQKKVRVDWVTQSEESNDYFIVEKSKDNKTFEPVGKIEGAGNSNSMLSYSFVDQNPFVGTISYYRLLQVDYNGAQHYTKTVAVVLRTNSESILNTYSDYDHHTVKIFIRNQGSETVDYTLTDAVGKTVIHGTQHLADDASEISIDMKNFRRGIYFSSVTINNKTELKRIIY